MEDQKADGKHSWPCILTIDVLLDALFYSPGKTLTKEQVLTHLGRYATYYRDLVEALVHTGKINEITGQEGGIELRTDGDLQPGILSEDEETQLLEHLSRLRDGESPSETPLPNEGKKPKESDFYQPFAEWLVKELEECTKAEPVGRNLFKDKWGTPDVMGVREPKKGDIIQLPTEIVSAEIKLDPNGLITAFGQACAYRLFSHKSYIVVPANSQQEDMTRLDALSRIFGIGLIRFNPKDPSDPHFDIRARAAKQDPDMSYVNQCMKLLVEAGIMWH
jgi:hypothetical protein